MTPLDLVRHAAARPLNTRRFSCRMCVRHRALFYWCFMDLNTRRFTGSVPRSGARSVSPRAHRVPHRGPCRFRAKKEKKKLKCLHESNKKKLPERMFTKKDVYLKGSGLECLICGELVRQRRPGRLALPESIWSSQNEETGKRFSCFVVQIGQTLV